MVAGVARLLHCSGSWATGNSGEVPWAPGAFEVRFTAALCGIIRIMEAKLWDSLDREAFLGLAS